MDDGSYCTQLDARSDRKLLERAAKAILKEAEKYPNFDNGFKRAMEQLSWIGIKNGKLI